mmetsp:Transcript_42003/g.97812  ORF Transcript_42003/g.97812 Transcript_42003/m.97812 type:complete len:776 (+) Transcript_42003:83-2410(+)
MSEGRLVLLGLVGMLFRSISGENADAYRFMECELEDSQNLHLIQVKGRLLADEPELEAPEMKGVSYGPSPFTRAERNRHQDYFCDAAEPMWGDWGGGRGDLRLIRSMGANTVRLYGNDPDLEHRRFLDHAHSLGLGVIPGMGDKAFAASACRGTGAFVCFEGARDAYLKNLNSGFLLANRSYHPAMKYFIVVNEPELKLPGLAEPKKFAKAIATAIDGVLEAEDLAGVVGPRPNLTVTFSFAACAQCEKFNDRPGLGQIWTLVDALSNPAKYAVQSQHNLTEFFRTRLTLSFNSGNPSGEIQNLFLKHYEEIFPRTPIFIAEYHNPGNPDLQGDLENILSIARSSALLLGISFFEFQNRYDQAGHLVWGMFDPQEEKTELRLNFEEFATAVPCLSPVFDKGRTIPQQLTAAYGGNFLHQNTCLANPQQVPVSLHGFGQIQGLQNVTAMQQFVKRAVEKLGGFVPYVVPRETAQIFVHPDSTYRELESVLTTHPEWARWDTFASCTVDKTALKSTLGGKIGYICGQGYADCDKIPQTCKEDLWDTASWVFGAHFKELVYAKDETPKPLQHCYLDGAAHFVRSSIWKKSAVKPECVVPLGWSDPNKVFITQHGFHLIWKNQDPTAMKIFIERAVEHMGGIVTSQVPTSFVKQMLALEASFESLQTALQSQPSWANWGSGAACVPDRAAKAREVGAAIGLVCSKNLFDCGSIPDTCKRTVWDNAAFAFGSYYKAITSTRQRAYPLYDCEFTGRAIFASPHVYKAFNLTEECVVPLGQS